MAEDGLRGYAETDDYDAVSGADESPSSDRDDTSTSREVSQDAGTKNTAGR